MATIHPPLADGPLVVGYSFGIRPELRLCDEVHLNLAYQ
jgi:hypothetical protein